MPLVSLQGPNGNKSPLWEALSQSLGWPLVLPTNQMTKFLARIRGSRICCHPLNHEGMCLPSYSEPWSLSLQWAWVPKTLRGHQRRLCFKFTLGGTIPGFLPPHNYPVPTSLIRQTDLRSHCQPCQALAGTYGAEPSVGSFAQAASHCWQPAFICSRPLSYKGRVCWRPKKDRIEIRLVPPFPDFPTCLYRVLNFLTLADYQSDSLSPNCI